MRSLLSFFNLNKKMEIPQDIRPDDRRAWDALDQDPELTRQVILTLALCAACKEGNQALGEYLLYREKAPVNGVMGYMDAPLYAAIDAQQPDMIRLLVRYGVNKDPWDLDKHCLKMTDEIWDILGADPLKFDLVP